MANLIVYEKFIPEIINGNIKKIYSTMNGIGGCYIMGDMYFRLEQTDNTFHDPILISKKITDVNEKETYKYYISSTYRSLEFEITKIEYEYFLSHMSDIKDKQIYIYKINKFVFKDFQTIKE